MSDYRDLVVEEAKTFLQSVEPEFETDSAGFGGKSESPNFAKWLDESRKLFTRLDEITKSWGRAEAEMVKAGSRNAVAYGDPKEAAYFAYYKDVLAELKKLRKRQR